MTTTVPSLRTIDNGRKNDPMMMMMMMMRRPRRRRTQDESSSAAAAAAAAAASGAAAAAGPSSSSQRRPAAAQHRCGSSSSSSSSSCRVVPPSFLGSSSSMTTTTTTTTKKRSPLRKPRTKKRSSFGIVLLRPVVNAAIVAIAAAAVLVAVLPFFSFFFGRSSSSGGRPFLVVVGPGRPCDAAEVVEAATAAPTSSWEQPPPSRALSSLSSSGLMMMMMRLLREGLFSPGSSNRQWRRQRREGGEDLGRPPPPPTLPFYYFFAVAEAADEVLLEPTTERRRDSAAAATAEEEEGGGRNLPQRGRGEADNDDDDDDDDDEEEEEEAFWDEEEDDNDDDDDDDDEKEPKLDGPLLRLTLNDFTGSDQYRALFEQGGRAAAEAASDDDIHNNNNTNKNRRSLVLALVVHGDNNNENDTSSPWSCRHTPIVLERFRQAAIQLQNIPTLRFGVLKLRDVTSLRALGVDRVPSLVFLTWMDEQDSVILMEYNGLSETSDDMAQTALHYWHRLVDATSGWDVTNQQRTVSVKVPHYSNYQELQLYLRTSRLLDPNVQPRVVSPLPPTLSDGDVRFAQWLLREEDEYLVPLSLPDDSKLFVQCRSSSSSSSDANDAYRMFDQASRALSNRRECFFATVNDCESIHSDDENGDDGTVAAFSIPYRWDYEYMEFVTNLDPTILRHHDRDDNTGSRNNAHHASASALMHDVTQFARPSVLWFDRQSTAPVVFGKDQKRHAILVVDMHPVVAATTHAGSSEANRVDDMAAVRDVFVHFRRQCRKYRGQLACLVVPSTETRVLLTLGIDIWSPLDEQVVRDRHPHHPSSTSGGSASTDEGIASPRPLPVVIMTDRQRVPGKTLMYRLDRAQLLGSDDSSATTRTSGSGAAALAQFFDDFVSHRLEPVIKSDPRGPRTNAAGVRVLTGTSVHELRSGDSDDDNQTSHHALVLFVAPTCGHCKRASVMWDRLARFLARVHWTSSSSSTSSFVRLYRMDVTENDVPDGVTPRWLPDAYHYRARTGTFTRFDWIQDDGDGTGRSDDDSSSASKSADSAADWDIVTLLEWFVSVANLTDAELSGLLRDLER